MSNRTEIVSVSTTSIKEWSVTRMLDRHNPILPSVGSCLLVSSLQIASNLQVWKAFGKSLGDPLHIWVEQVLEPSHTTFFECTLLVGQDIEH